MYFLFLLYFSPLKGRCWHRNKMVSWFITVMNFQTVLYLSFSPVLLGVDVNWLFVIIKSYVKVNFKERNNNNNNIILVILEKFREAIDRESEFGAFLTNLLQTFDYTGHKLLITKLYRYSFSNSSKDHFLLLKNRTQQT